MRALPAATMAPPSEFVRALAGALAGGLGGMVSAFVLFPLDVLKTRQQGGEKLGIFALTKKLVKQQGVFGLWNGSLFSACQSMCEKFGYFFGYTLLRNIYRRVTGADAGTIATLAIGYCSEWSHLIFTLPMDKVKVMKVKRMGTDQPQDLGTCVKDAWRQGNLHSGAGGFQLLALKPATQFATYEPTKAFWLARQGGSSLSSLAAFMLGAFSRLVSDTLIYPGRRAKVQKQSLGKLGPNSTKEEKEMSNKGAVALCVYIVKTQGFGGLYRGLPMELFRGVLSGALLLLVKERMDSLARRVLLRGA